jgi:hypothetical protein
MAPKAIVPQKMMEKVEVLELKPIETVRQELEALSPVPRQEKTVDTKLENAVPVASVEPTMPVAPEKEVEPEGEAPENVPETPEPAVPEPISFQPVQKPVSEPFSIWVSRFQPPVLEPKPKASAPETPPKPTRASSLPPEKGVAQQLAERSVSENKDVISETLARLLVKQGHKDKAVIMYERLCLAFPEKSAYFAAEIEKLKN